MKTIVTETFAWVPAFSVALTINPEQLFVSMAALLMLFFKGVIATLASLIGRWLGKLIFKKIESRFDRQAPITEVKKAAAAAASSKIRTFFGKKTIKN